MIIDAAIINADEEKQITFGTIESNDLAAYQRIVGGYIEIVELTAGRMYINEEGAIAGLPMNRRASVIVGKPIVGDVVVVGRDGNNRDADLPLNLRTPFALINLPSTG